MKPITIRNTYAVRLELTEPDPSNDRDQPYTNGSTVQAWLSATDGGPTIHADLVVSIAQLGISKVFRATFPQAAITAHLFDDSEAPIAAVVWAVIRGTGVEASMQIPVVAKRLVRPA